MRADSLATLGLRHGADESAIKEAYRKMALRYHPDVNASAEAAALFRAATEAYEQLLENGGEHQQAQGSHGPAMEARWNIKRRHRPAEYPAWFKPPGQTPPDGTRLMHLEVGSAGAALGQRAAFGAPVHWPTARNAWRQGATAAFGLTRGRAPWTRLRPR
jgi:hypothetical protein